jgi:hypothetical protein
MLIAIDASPSNNRVNMTSVIVPEKGGGCFLGKMIPSSITLRSWVALLKSRESACLSEGDDSAVKRGWHHI